MANIFDIIQYFSQVLGGVGSEKANKNVFYIDYPVFVRGDSRLFSYSDLADAKNRNPEEKTGNFEGKKDPFSTLENFQERLILQL